MKANKTYGNMAMYPNEVMNITQSIWGAYSHMGANAIDDAQRDTGINNGFAPCDMVCVATDYENGNFMFWQSQDPVMTVAHGTTHIVLMVGHDNTANAYVGMKIKQGEQLFSEGTAGNADGNHNHIEVAIGEFTSMYVLNSYGVYMLPNNVNPAEVFFIDDTEIINNGGLDWHTTSSNAPVQTPTIDQVLAVGSHVVFDDNLSVNAYDMTTGLVYNERLGVWLPPAIMYEDSANDGAQDQYFATTLATFTIQGTYTVGGLRLLNGTWQAYLNELGYWVNCEPLIEVV